MQSLLRAWTPTTDAADATPAQRVRADWVDVAKGLGIVLVVAGHAIDGLLGAGLADRGGAWGHAFWLIYSFHMPLFFVLAGLFVQPRVSRDRQAFAQDIALRIVWPYLLWSVLQLAVIDAMGGWVNRPAELDGWRVLALLWEPTSQFWFLQALLLLHVSSALLLPAIGAQRLLLLFVVLRLVGEVVELPVMLALPCRFGLFYALGVLWGPALVRRLAMTPAPAPGRPWRGESRLALGAALALAWLATAGAAYAVGAGYWGLLALPAALAGGAALVVLAAAARGPVAAALAALGQASMAIFVLHVLFVAGARIALHRLAGIDAAWLLATLAIAAGIAGPLILRQLAVRAGCARALGLG